MKTFFSLVLFLIPSFLLSQLTVVSTLPVNNATNVPLTATISVTFSEAVDTVIMNSEDIFFSNIDWNNMVSSSWTSDLKTSNAVVNLQPNTAYFLALTYAKAVSGAKMITPFVYYFTTGPSFPPNSVSGTLYSGSTGVIPERAFVGLMTQSIQETEGGPTFVAWTNVNNNGSFTVPHVANGTYWPIAAKDVDGDGTINPETGTDVIAIGDSIVVNNASVTNITLTFISLKPLTYHQAVPIADSIANLRLPADRVLRYVNSWGVDTLGRGIGTWHFIYTGRNNTVVYDVPGSQFEGGVDSMRHASNLSWIASRKPILNHALAAPSPSVIMNVENAGGKQFRALSVPMGAKFGIEMNLGDYEVGEFFGQVPDTSKLYWSVRYIWEINQEPWILNGRKYLVDFSTGAVLLTGMLDVKRETSAPLSFELFQNYPNPFNPTTNISFTVPVSGHAALKVYNMLGQEVAVLYNGEAVAGTLNRMVFNASGLASGLYFSKLEFNGKVQMKKMMLIK